MVSLVVVCALGMDSRYQMTIVVHRRDMEPELGWWWLKDREVLDRTAERSRRLTQQRCWV